MVVQQFIYDPWGKQYNVHTNSLFNAYSSPAVSKGYTGHKMINDMDIIHMNGRTYNVVLGRFMQADPNIQAPLNMQNYNRYSYVLNNPMSMTDPSGYFFKKLFKGIKKYWRTIAAIVVTVYLGPAASAFFGSTVAGGAVAGFVAGGIATGSLRGAVVGAFTGAVFGQLHNMAAGTGKVVAHGIAGGVSSVLNGGKFGHGFLSAGFTQAMGNIKGLFTNAPQGMARISNAVKAAIIGGTASAITGGKFANGAMTGAFSRLLNDDIQTSRKHSIGVSKTFRKLIGSGVLVFDDDGNLIDVKSGIQVEKLKMSINTKGTVNVQYANAGISIDNFNEALKGLVIDQSPFSFQVNMTGEMATISYTFKTPGSVSYSQTTTTEPFNLFDFVGRTIPNIGKVRNHNKATCAMIARYGMKGCY